MYLNLGDIVPSSSFFCRVQRYVHTYVRARFERSLVAHAAVSKIFHQSCTPVA